MIRLLVVFLIVSFGMVAENTRLGDLLAHSHASAHAVGLNSEDDVEAEVWREPTPEQPKGPFYPIRIPDDSDQDLTTNGDGHAAKGVQVYIQGQVMDQDGNPLEDAQVEIWQACQTGKYNHPRDPNDAVPDPNFQYYGTTQTDATGKYIFKTIVPGPYPANTRWWRPPHVHYMVTKTGYNQLITQLYFDGGSFPDSIATIGGRKVTGEVIDNMNRLDYLLNDVPKADRWQLVTSFKNVKVGEKQSPLGVFNLYLESQQ